MHFSSHMSPLEFHFDMTNISEIGACGRNVSEIGALIYWHHRFCSSAPTEAPPLCQTSQTFLFAQKAYRSD